MDVLLSQGRQLEPKTASSGWWCVSGYLQEERLGPLGPAGPQTRRYPRERRGLGPSFTCIPYYQLQLTTKDFSCVTRFGICNKISTGFIIGGCVGINKSLFVTETPTRSNSLPVPVPGPLPLSVLSLGPPTEVSGSLLRYPYLPPVIGGITLSKLENRAAHQTALGRDLPPVIGGVTLSKLENRSAHQTALGSADRAVEVR